MYSNYHSRYIVSKDFIKMQANIQHHDGRDSQQHYSQSDIQQQPTLSVELSTEVSNQILSPGNST